MHLLHHRLHLVELRQHAVDVLYLNAGTDRNAPLAAGLDELGLGALGGRHRMDDALHAPDILFGAVHVGLSGCSLHLRRQFVHHRRQATHLFHLADLGEEVIQIEPAAALELFGQTAGCLVVDAGLRLLDQGEDVAHAEDAIGHAVGVKGVEPVEFFAGAHELDRAAGDRLDRERRPAA